jgi:RHS repeat-associated protein
VVLAYTYDPDNRLTNRWSAAKANTGYAYDPVGNLTNIAYPSSGTVNLAYDVLNRLTNMVDGLGTTRYSYDAAGQLLTEDGLFTSDTVTNTYSNRRRVGLRLQQPTGLWTNGFAWDLAGRLTNVTSPAGAFGYTYTPLYSGFSGRLVQQLSLPNGAAVTNLYDPVARLLNTVLRNSSGTTIDAAYYGYNAGNQRTAYTNAAGGRYYHYTYDAIGQVTVGTSSTSSENRGYAYDAAWNLHYLTNNGALSTLAVDNKNELTNAFGAAYGYDSNGNLTAGDGSHNAYVYDDENRLVQWFWYETDSSHLTNGALRTDFFYDGLGRLRERVEYDILGSTGSGSSASQSPFGPLTQQQPAWTFNYGVLYLYDGMRVIQERDSNNVPLVSYTRGLDLSGSLEGAGGIGGLLARSSGYSSGNWTSHAYYHADGNGNITCLIASNQLEVATYRYDPFGNTLSQSGTLADANVYRFSSKEIHTNSLMYYYGYRFYDPGLQRWLNRDPLGEPGFESLRLVSQPLFIRKRRFSLNEWEMRFLLANAIRSGTISMDSYLRNSHAPYVGKTISALAFFDILLNGQSTYAPNWPAELLQNPNLYNSVGNDPLDAFDTWGNTWWKPWTWEWPEALWEALKHIVAGSEFTGPLECGPGLYQIGTNQIPKIQFDPFDPNSPVPPHPG